MMDVLNLALPFFGLIFLGYACGRIKQIPDAGLAWMNFFLIYVALPVLFYRILAKTPFEKLANAPFVVATTLATASIFAISFAIGLMLRKGNPREATITGLAGAYGNVGYMGPGLALATLGPEAAVPVALIFCFDNMLLFALVPTLMALAERGKMPPGAAALDVVKRIALHPFIIATVAGVVAAATHFEAPVAIDRLMEFLQNAAAPCALFALGVTVALRPLESVPWEVPPIVLMKLVAHPLAVLALLWALGPMPEVWVYTGFMMAALPPALNVFIMARQYDTWVQQASGAVLIGTLASVVTLTAAMLMVKMRLLPDVLFQ
ncbi:MAG: AEC family transporter [Variibacter sp.]